MTAAGGSLTDHHGVGDRTGHVELQYPRAVVEAIAGLRRTLDPTGVMNPGVLADWGRYPGPSVGA